jgi:hypothetical protein
MYCRHLLSATVIGRLT